MTIENLDQSPRLWLGTLQILTSALMWGTTGTFAKYLFNNSIAVYDIAQSRLILSFLLLFITLLIFKPKLLVIKKEDIPYFIIFGILGLGVTQICYITAISYTNVATGIFLQYMAPALVLIYGLITKTENPTVQKFLALAASISGGYLIVLGNSQGFGFNLIGLSAGGVSAFAFAFYSIYGKYGLNKYNAWTLLMWGSGFAALVWTFYQFPWVIITRYSGLALLQLFYIGVTTVVPFGIFIKGLQHLSAFRAGLISTLEPVIGAFTAFVFLGERLNRLQNAGSGLILLAIVLIQTADLRKRKQK